MIVSIIGLGRIGLPLSLVLASKGVKVYGFDVDQDYIEELKSLNIKIFEKALTTLLHQTLNKTFIPRTFSFKSIIHIDESSYIIIAVGIEPNIDGDTSLNRIYKIIDMLHSLLHGKTLILRATVPVGSTRKLKHYIERKYGLRESKDFFLAYVPERLAEGYAIEEEQTLPKIIGAFSDAGFKETRKLFSILPGPIYRASSPEVAELVKLVDNAYRNLLFSFANEVALLCDKLGVNAKEVLKLARQDYPRNLGLPDPGPVSGYCLTKDPIIYNITYRRFFKEDSLTYIGRRINDRIIDEIANKCRNYTKIAVLGLSYKKDVDDFRSSHSIQLIEKLLQVRKDIEIYVHDPYLNVNKWTKVPQHVFNRIRVLSDLNMLQTIAPEVVIVATPHSIYRNMLEVIDGPWLLIDLYNALYVHKSLFNRAEYRGIGI